MREKIAWILLLVILLCLLTGIFVQTLEVHPLNHTKSRVTNLENAEMMISTTVALNDRGRISEYGPLT